VAGTGTGQDEAGTGTGRDEAGTGTGRDTWITAAMTLLARGVSPAEMKVADLCAVMPQPLTRGSFNWHFRDGRLAALHREIIGRWQAERTAACDTIRSERDLAQLLAAAHGPADSAMRRWAAAPPPAGAAARDVHRQLTAAVAQVNQAITAHLDAALAHMGFRGRKAAGLAAALAAAFAPAGPAAPTAPDAFKVLLAVLRGAAAPAGAREVQEIDGDDGEILLVLAARNVPPGQLAGLRQAARQFLADAGQ